MQVCCGLFVASFDCRGLGLALNPGRTAPHLEHRRAYVAALQLPCPPPATLPSRHPHPCIPQPPARRLPSRRRATRCGSAWRPACACCTPSCHSLLRSCGSACRGGRASSKQLLSWWLTTPRQVGKGGVGWAWLVLVPSGRDWVRVQGGAKQHGGWRGQGRVGVGVLQRIW